MKTIHSLVLVFAAVLFVARPALGQGVGTSGEIRGIVTDPTGAVVPRASISAVETARGEQLTVNTDNGGNYRFASLAPASYDVTAKIQGFQTEVVRGIVVTVGQITVVDIHLKVATSAATVEVNAEPPVVETERGSQADTLTQGYIEDLPIDRRDYLTFTLLLPGVSDSTRLMGDQDFRVKETPQSGLSFYGSNGRGNSITVDGGEMQDDAGGVRPTMSQDAVQEFQVNRSNYGADLGGASGASINIVSKSGTNDIHGTMFGFFRNDALDAQDPFSFTPALTPTSTFSPDAVGTPVKNSLERYQFGGNVGLPIQKDKTFLFVAFEGLRQDQQNAVPLLTNSDIFAPTPAQQTILAGLTGLAPVPCLVGPVGIAVANQLMLPPPTLTTPNMLPAAECAAVLGGALSVNPANGPLDAFLVNQFETNGGLFDYNTRQYLGSVRLDHRIDAANQLSLTYRYAHDWEESPDVHSLTGFSAGSKIHLYDNNIQASWFHQFSPTAENELRVQFNYDSFNVIPNVPAQVGLQIPGFANNLGSNIFLPDYAILRRWEFADNFSKILGHHTMKFGVDELLRGNHSESHTFFPGRFVFGTLPGDLLTVQLPTLSSLQSASFSLPQVYQQGFGDADYPAYTRPLTGLYWQDSWAMTSNFTLTYGLRYDIDSQYNPLNTYYADFGPRISFAWDPFKDHKTVVRGGYGIFYGPVDAQISQVDLSLGVLNANKSTVENIGGKNRPANQVPNLINACGLGFPGFPIFPAAAGSTSPCTRYISIYVDPLTPTGLPIETADQVFGALFAQGLIQCTTPAPGNAACITPASLGPVPVINPTGTGIVVANKGQLSPLQVVFSNPPNYKPPISQQASFGIEREIVPGFSVSVSGIYSHTTRIPVALDTNLVPPGANPGVTGPPISTVTLANGKQVSYTNWNTSAAADPLGGTEFPGGVFPCAITLNGFGQPVSPCFRNVLVTQNNQYTSAASSLYEGFIFEAKKRFSNHFSVFGNYTFSKAFDTSTDFNSDYGPQDPTNLGLDRALSEFDERHKVVIAGVFDSPWKNAILSGFQFSPIFTYHSGLPFNLLAGGEVNGDNHTTNERPIGAPRDTGLGPSFYDFDARLTWSHKLGERVNMAITAEGFNIANRTNYASVNNEVGPVFGFCQANGSLCNPGQPAFTTFNVRGIKPGAPLLGGGFATPSTPQAFTSDFPRREIQLGLRFSF